MKKSYVPVRVLRKGRSEVWHIGVEKLNYSGLNEQRNQLLGTDNDTAIRCIDREIYSRLKIEDENRRQKKKDNKSRIRRKRGYRW